MAAAAAAADGPPWPPAAAWPPPKRQRDGRQISSGPHELSAAQLRLVEEMTALCRDIVPLPDSRRMSDEDMMIRFLIARKWKPRDAETMIRGSMAWRRQNRIDDIFQWSIETFPPDLVLTTHTGGMCGFYGRDVEGNPVCWDRPSAGGVDAVLRDYPRENLVKWQVYVIERSRELARALGVDRFTSVLDLSDVGSGALTDSTRRKFVQEQSRYVQEFLPENTRKVFMVNAPGALRFGYNMFVKPFLDKRVQDKINILGARAPGDDLEKWIPLSETPNEFGGQAMVDWERSRMRPSADPLFCVAACPSYAAAVPGVAHPTKRAGSAGGYISAELVGSHHSDLGYHPTMPQSPDRQARLTSGEPLVAPLGATSPLGRNSPSPGASRRRSASVLTDGSAAMHTCCTPDISDGDGDVAEFVGGPPDAPSPPAAAAGGDGPRRCERCRGPMCPAGAGGGKGVEWSVNGWAAHACDAAGCGAVLYVGDLAGVLRCERCDYDLCRDCAAGRRPAPRALPPPPRQACCCAQ